jgi:hypothetical protein
MLLHVVKNKRSGNLKRMNPFSMMNEVRKKGNQIQNFYQ